MANNKYAAYIAGDLNIIESSLVVFTSLKKYEKEIDLFLYLSSEISNKKIVKQLEALGVNIEVLEEEKVFENSITWPKESFLNFSVPPILYKKGYEIGIKLDYDILINGKLDVEKNKPKKDIFSMTEHNYEKLRDMVRGDYEFFEEKYKIKNWDKKATLFGNVYINLEKYVEEKIWEKYKQTYNEIIKESPTKTADIIFADMGLFNVLMEKYDYTYEKIDEKYNTCVSYRHLTNISKLNFSPNVIHYPGPKKPWKKLGLKVLTNPYFTYYRNLWWKFIEENQIELKFISEGTKGYDKKYESEIYKLYIKYFLKIKK